MSVEGITKTIDGVKVLDNVSFIVGHDDKIAFVGGNELAKTTLFKILTGEMEPDSGSYKWGVTTSQSYFPKDNTEIFDTDLLIVDWLTQYSEIKDATYVRGFLGRMLFAGEDGTKKMRVLSGGEKVRVLLSRMMIMATNVLILDEPTDHLDMESITALNNGLIKFPGVVLFASVTIRSCRQLQTGSSSSCRTEHSSIKFQLMMSILKMMRWQENVRYIICLLTMRTITKKIALTRIRSGSAVF